jgi:hypothetical protein
MALRLSSHTQCMLRCVLEADDKDLMLKMVELRELASAANLNGENPQLGSIARVLTYKIEHFDEVNKSSWRELVKKLEPSIAKYHTQLKTEIDRQYWVGERR